jgi:hypothetical protein
MSSQDLAMLCTWDQFQSSGPIFVLRIYYVSTKVFPIMHWILFSINTNDLQLQKIFLKSEKVQWLDPHLCFLSHTSLLIKCLKTWGWIGGNLGSSPVWENSTEKDVIWDVKHGLGQKWNRQWGMRREGLCISGPLSLIAFATINVNCNMTSKLCPYR